MEYPPNVSVARAGWPTHPVAPGWMGAAWSNERTRRVPPGGCLLPAAGCQLRRCVRARVDLDTVTGRAVRLGQQPLRGAMGSATRLPEPFKRGPAGGVPDTEAVPSTSARESSGLPSRVTSCPLAPTIMLR